jgi:hypothetical protein
MAAAGLWTTPTDVARWAIGIADADAGRANAVLSQATAKAMLTPGLGDWGLGVAVKGEGQDRRFSHGGANEGFRNEMFAFPARGQAVVIMTNSDSGGNVMGPWLTAIAQTYGWPGFERKIIKPAAMRPGELAAYVGTYVLDKDTITIREHAGGQSLDLVAPGDDVYELIPQGSDAFADASSADPAKFERDAGGKVTTLDFADVKLTRKP